MRIQTGRLLPITVYFTCGSVVRFCLFRNMWHTVPHVPEKNVLFRPAGGESGCLFRHMPDLELTA